MKTEQSKPFRKASSKTKSRHSKNNFDEEFIKFIISACSVLLVAFVVLIAFIIVDFIIPVPMAMDRFWLERIIFYFAFASILIFLRWVLE